MEHYCSSVVTFSVEAFCGFCGFVQLLRVLRVCATSAGFAGLLGECPFFEIGDFQFFQNRYVQYVLERFHFPWVSWVLRLFFIPAGFAGFAGLCNFCGFRGFTW